MRISSRGRVLLAGACLLAGAAGWAQQSQKPDAADKVSTDLAATFAVEHFESIALTGFGSITDLPLIILGIIHSQWAMQEVAGSSSFAPTLFINGLHLPRPSVDQKIFIRIPVLTP